MLTKEVYGQWMGPTGHQLRDPSSATVGMPGLHTVGPAFLWPGQGLWPQGNCPFLGQHSALLRKEGADHLHPVLPMVVRATEGGAHK